MTEIATKGLGPDLSAANSKIKSFLKANERNAEMKTTGKIFSVAVIIATLLCSLLCINAFAEGTEKSARIISNNVYYGEKVALMYAVEAQNLAEGDDVKVVIYDEEGALVGNAEYWKDDTVNGIESKIYISAGVPAQKIDTVFYAKVQIVSGGETVYESSTAQRYSVLEYLHERLFCEEITEDQEALYKGLLTYAELAQKVLIDGIAEEDYISNYAYVAIEGGTLDGTYSAGMYKKTIDGLATEITTVSTDETIGSGATWKIDQYDLEGQILSSGFSEEQSPAITLSASTAAFILSITKEELTTATLVTDATKLTVGSKIVIVATAYDYALSTEQKTNNRGVAAITKDGNSFTVGDAVQVITLESGATDGTFAFNVETGYLYAAGADNNNNYLKTKNTIDATSSWNITIDSNTGVASIIVADSATTKNTLRYNSTSTLFSCYASGQKDISIYIINE